VEHYQEGQKIMNIKEIEELALLLEGENPSSHGEWLRLRADALTALTWLTQASGPRVTPENQHVTELLQCIYRGANIGIGQYVAKPRLCLNKI
jgi:hypothetical protein